MARSSMRLVLLAIVTASLADRAHAAPDPALATRVFAEAHVLCTRDHGALWGRSLCGPMLLVDYTDLGVLANQADAEGRLTRDGALFRGTLPDSVIVANTPTEWAGTRWTQIDVPLPGDDAARHVLLAHELFHRIQPSLGLTRPEAGNGHLDTLDGRMLLQLEWRALAAALRARTEATRDAAIVDALAFRRERYRLFPAAADDEGALEINEGVPEYTGVRVGLATPAERIAFAIHDLSAFVAAPTFVRAFAYATGPAYGLLLDRVDPAWRGRLASGRRLDELLADGARLQMPATPTLAAGRTARYDDGALRAAEVQRDADKRARLAAYRARLVEGPVLTLPLLNANYQFNPQTLVPLDGAGTIYPSLRLTDDWGALEVARGGALVGTTTKGATVTAAGVDGAARAGDGWTLKLQPGWIVVPGDRPGDLVVRRSSP